MPPIFRGRIRAIKMYPTVNIQYMAICIVIFAYKRPIPKGIVYTRQKKKPACVKSFLKSEIGTF